MDMLRLDFLTGANSWLVMIEKISTTKSLVIKIVLRLRSSINGQKSKNVTLKYENSL
jgi:hypothetical protein